MKFLAYTVKGIEPIAKSELIKKLALKSEPEISLKKVGFEGEFTADQFKQLQTIDDIHILISSQKLEYYYDDSSLLGLFDLRNVQSAFEFIKNFRTIGDTFSITVTKTDRTFWEKETLIKEFSEYISKTLNLTFIPKNRTNLDFKLFIDDEKAYLSLRIFEKSLFHREYKVNSIKGSLRPSIAAALLYSTNLELSNLKIVDLMCGAGTILCEGALAGSQVYGSEISKEAVKVAKSNLARVNEKFIKNIYCEDGLNSHWQNESFDIVAVNPPWDSQYKIENKEEFYKSLINEALRITKASGYYRFLATDLNLAKLLNERLKHSHKVYSIRLGHLGQVPYIICANPIKTA